MPIRITKKSTVLIALGLIFLGVIASVIKGDEMVSNGLILIPEPTLGRFVFGGYTLDEDATADHYNKLFEGKSAEEIIQFLKEQEKRFTFNSDSEISIILDRLVGFFYYNVGISFIFENGIFLKAEIWSKGVL